MHHLLKHVGHVFSVVVPVVNSVNGATSAPIAELQITSRGMKQIAAAAMLLVATNGLCQLPQKDNDTLQSLMGEVHQLRRDIEAMTVASQRVQVALYQL